MVRRLPQSSAWPDGATGPGAATPPARSSPARAGPPITAAWNMARFRARAPGRLAGGTRRGMSACRAGLSNADAAAVAALRP